MEKGGGKERFVGALRRKEGAKGGWGGVFLRQVMRRELENWGFGVWDVWRDERKMVTLPERWRAQCFMAPGWRREGRI